MEQARAATGSAIVRAERVQVTAEAVRIGMPKPANPTGEPTLQLQREGDAIQTIQVTCSCGQTICIRCEYS